MDTKSKEWDDLSQSERNCLMWPELLLWGEIRNTKVRRQDPNCSLDLVTTVSQDPETKHYYHITGRIKDNHPAHGKVNSFEWICAVDDKPTTKGKEIEHLIQNGDNIVRLSLRTVVDPLSTPKTWAMEKVVQVDIKEKKCGFELVPFYCKEDNGNVKDRILIRGVNADPRESGQRFYRGDELLAVNGEPVEGKNLAQIYEIFTRVPYKVELKIKNIQRGKCSCQVSKTPDMPAVQSRPPMSDAQNSGSKNGVENEEHPSNEYPPERPGRPSNSREVSIPVQDADNGGPSGSASSYGSSTDVKKDVPQSSVNEAPSKTYPSTDKMCITCIKTETSRLPDDRNKWHLNKIEYACYENICTLLDLDGSRIPLLSALECFNGTEASRIKKICNNTGGIGIAQMALDRWGNMDRSHNVGALKVIVKDKMLREDVIEEIEKWEKLNVCHGCGIRLKENN